LKPAGLYDEKGDAIEGAALINRRFVAVCGVAQPASFASTLASLDLFPEKTLVFRDHHRYAPRDIALIHRRAEASGGSWILTTEKDAVKLSGRLRLPLATLRLSVEIAEPGFFPVLASLIAGTPGAVARAGR
jgi:tetraacyldisaccharide-1-P 4'-kinase